MPVLPKSLVTLGASLLTVRTAAKLRRTGAAVPAQEKTLARLLPRLAATEQGRRLGLAGGQRHADFSRRVPLRTYEHFAPDIERMKRGEPDVLWPGRCAFFAVSSGTTAGRTKYLPVTEDMLRHFRRAGLASLFYYTARVGHAGVFRGRHLFLGGATTLAPLPDAPAPAFSGDLSGITALNLPGWAERHLYEPGAAIAQLEDWPAKITAIAERTHRRDITLLAGIPGWLLILAAAVMQRAADGKARPTHLRAVWPNLECLVHGGVPITPFADELRLACGHGVNFHEVYPASEAFIAAQDAESSQGLRLIADAGVFYEFLPLADYDENRLAELGPKAVPLAGVRSGVDYVLLLTTPAGLTRYVIGDVVRFTDTAPHRLIYVGRTRLQLSAFGEHVIEKEVTDSLLNVCQRHGWTIVNFHVAPVFANSLTGQTRGRHEWWIELRPGTVATPTGPLLAAELDVELQRLNEDYEAKRRGGGMDAPSVRLVMPGVFEQWMRSRGKWGGQNKMPRCRSDREIADELAQLTRFKTDTQPPWNRP
ncbi:MAG: GH3 auxin-responsive promoter family protein [Opitutaceae bacterium]|nr:GH3 auxin-responsive promoter family protein [Opitutaceae bacterium]